MFSKKIISISCVLCCIVAMLGCSRKMNYAPQGSISPSATTTKTGPLLAVGQSYRGGIIFYVDSTGEHGLIAPSRQLLYAQWGCVGTTVEGTSDSIGAGEVNTAAILKVCSHSNCAARVCDDLVLNNYNDWYLPSEKELDLLYAKKRHFRPFKTNYYWTSTVVDDENARCLDFYDGHKMKYEKTNSFYVYPIRSF